MYCIINRKVYLQDNNWMILTVFMSKCVDLKKHLVVGFLKKTLRCGLPVSCFCSSLASSLKVSAAHQSSQTLVSSKRGELLCGIEGNAAQVLWKKVGMKHRLPFSRVLSLNSKTLRFHRVHKADAGTYECRAYSGSASAVATVNVIVVGEYMHSLTKFEGQKGKYLVQGHGAAASSMCHDLEPNIIPSSPPTQSGSILSYHTIFMLNSMWKSRKIACKYFLLHTFIDSI